MKKGIIFDLDGTLWDATGAMRDSYHSYMDLYHSEMPFHAEIEDFRHACGMPMDKFAAYIFRDLKDVPDLTRLADECVHYQVGFMMDHPGNIFPGVMETLKELSGEYHLYIVSNCQVGYIGTFLNAGAESYIEDIEEFGQTGLQKDENIRLLMERNHLDQAVYVGDTAGDYNSTLKAGIPFIFASYGFGSVEDPGVVRINDITELKAAVEKVFERTPLRHVDS